MRSMLLLLVICIASLLCLITHIGYTGATDHVTPSKINLQQAKNVTTQSHINLPDGNTASVTCLGKVKLNNGVELKDVQCVPSFKFNLLFVSKLTKDSKCIVIFYDTFCVIQDYVTN